MNKNKNKIILIHSDRLFDKIQPPFMIKKKKNKKKKFPQSDKGHLGKSYSCRDTRQQSTKHFPLRLSARQGLSAAVTGTISQEKRKEGSQL